MSILNSESPPTTPRRNRQGEAPTSPAVAYRMQYSHGEAQETASDTNKSPVKKKHRTSFPPPPCSICSSECTKSLSVSLGARVAIAVGIGHFPRGLTGSLTACITCYRAISRAEPLISALEEIVIQHPPLDGTADFSLRQIDNPRLLIQTLQRSFNINPSQVEAQLRLLPPTSEWMVLPAFCGGQLMLLKSPTDNKFGIVVLCEVHRDTRMVMVRDPLETRRFAVAYNRLMPLPEHGVAAGVAAAPRATEVTLQRLKGRLSDANSRLRSITTAAAVAETEHRDEMGQMRTALSASSHVNVLLSNKAKIAEQTVGHAYSRGMHDRLHLESELERSRQQVKELESENSNLKAAAMSKQREIKAAHEAQKNANAEMARALLVRSQASEEVIEAKARNDHLEAEISKMKDSAMSKDRENKAAYEAQNTATVEMARAILVRSQADKEIIEAKAEIAQLETQISTLKIAFHESDRASAEATNLKLQAYVEMARALHIRQQAEREVVEIRNKNGQLALENDRLRKQIERHSIRHASPTSAHSYDTRAMSEKSATQKLEQANIAASLILKAASEDALSWSSSVAPPEKMERSHLELSHHLRALPGGIALETLIRSLNQHLSHSDIVRLIVELLPLSIFAVVGSFLNNEVRAFAKGSHGSTLTSRWDSAPESVQIFLRELLMTGRQRRNSTSELRADVIRARYFTILSIVIFTLDPSDSSTLQRPIAQLLLGGQVMKLHQLLNYMGVSVSHSDYQHGAASRRILSRELLLLSLNAWGSVCKNGTSLSTRCHLDNIDDDVFHCIIVGLSRLDPPSPGIFTQKRLNELLAQSLFQKKPVEAAAVLKQFKISLGVADAAFKKPGANELVLRLFEDNQASIHMTKELENQRSQKRPGRKPAVHDDVPEVEALHRDREGVCVTAIKDLIVQDSFGCNFDIKTGDNLIVIESYPGRDLAIVQKGEGITLQTAWVETAVFIPKNSGISLQRPYSLPTFSHMDSADTTTVEDKILFDEEIRRATAADKSVVVAVNEALLRNVHLPRSKTPCSSQIVGIFDGLASSRNDCNAALNQCIDIVRTVDPNARVLYSVDGQPFGAEQKYRDALRQRHQTEIDKINFELTLEGISSDEHERLYHTRMCLEASRDAVSDLCPVELGTLHTEFAGVRALFKMYSESAYRGLCDRMGLGHAFDNIASCSSGYLSLGLDFLKAVKQAWLMEIIFLKAKTFFFLNEDTRDFISRGCHDSDCMRVYHRVLCTDPAAVINLRTSDRMRAREAKDLQCGAQKDTALVVAGGGCPNYIKWLAWSLRQEHTSTAAYQSLLVVNPTTHITETGQNFGPDEHLESNMVNGADAALGSSVHKANVVKRGAELNATIGCTFRVEEDLMPACTQRARAQLVRGEHKSKLNEDAVIAIARAAIRSYICPVIEAELKMSLAANPGSGAAPLDPSPILSLPRIPTRAEEEQKAAHRSVPRHVNPQFLIGDQLALERTIEVAKWALRKSIGGTYDVSETLKAIPPITFFTRERKEALSRMKKQSSKLEAIVAILSNDPGARKTLEIPRCLGSIVDDNFEMNSGSKSDIRTALQQLFDTCKPMTGASAWLLGAVNSRIRRGSLDVTAKVKIGHLILDVPFLIRLFPQPEPLHGGATITGADLVFNVLGWLLKPLLRRYKKVSYVEDFGGELAKMPLEQKRDGLRMKKGSSLSSTSGSSTPLFTLETVFEQSPNVASLYGNRNWRLLWQAAVGEVLTVAKWRQKLFLALGDGAGVVTFSGVGSSANQRQCTFTLSPSPDGFGRDLNISSPSKQKEDTQCLLLAIESIKSGVNTEIRGEDTDFLLLGLLAIDEINPTEDGVERGGKLFVHTNSREVIEKDGTKFKEEIFCCNDLASAIRSTDSFASIDPSFRVASIVALMILLGGDTTSYMYIPYVKALSWFLLHAVHIGSLVRVPSDVEATLGMSIILDINSVNRLFKMLYICLNPRVVPGWKSMLPSECAAVVDALECEDIEKRIAREVFPRVQRFMPSKDNLKWHIARAQQRLQTWHNARLLNPRDVQLTGFAVVMRSRPGTMIDEQEKRIDEPSLEEIEANDEWLLLRVEPIVERVNRTLSWLFGGDDPAQLLLKRKQTRTRTPRTEERPARKDELLGGARDRLKVGSKLSPTVAQMQAVVVSYKSWKGAGRNELSDIRKGMKGKAATVAAFKEVLASCSADSLPWKEMGAPEELPLGLGYAQVANADVAIIGEDSDCGDDTENDDSTPTGENDNNDSSDEENEDDELDVLGDVVDNVVDVLGDSADEFVHAVDAAMNAEEVCEAIESGLRRGMRQRAAPERMDL